MEIEIDPVAGTVTRAGEVWQLDLDCRDGTVRVTGAGSSHRLRPLRWREKQRLTHLAAYGPAVVARARVATTRLDGTDPLPPASLEVLDAVSAWLDGSDPVLPLERGLLAAVTVELCRAAGLRPADLDDRDADEVEGWWRATSAGATEWPAAAIGSPGSPTADPWADATSIRFEPSTDETAPSLRSVDDAPAQPPPVPSVDDAPPPPPGPARRQPSAEEQPAAAELAGPRRGRHGPPVSEPSSPSGRGPRTTPAPRSGVRPLDWDGSPIPSAASRLDRPAPLATAPVAIAGRRPPDADRPSSEPPPPLPPLAAVARPGRGLALEPAVTAVRLPVAAVPEPFPPAPSARSAAGDRSDPAVLRTALAPPGAPRAELVERILDELVDGIERAAADLGIEV